MLLQGGHGDAVLTSYWPKSSGAGWLGAIRFLKWAKEFEPSIPTLVRLEERTMVRAVGIEPTLLSEPDFEALQ